MIDQLEINHWLIKYLIQYIFLQRRRISFLSFCVALLMKLYYVDTENTKIIDIKQTSLLRSYEYLLKLCNYILTALEIEVSLSSLMYIFL